MSRRRARLSILLAIVLAVIAGTALFRVSQQVQVAEEEQQNLIAAVASEKEAIRVLNAEWDYLNRPDRLEELSQEYLHMQQPQMKQMENSPEQLPETRAPEMKAQPAVMEVPASAPRPIAKPQRVQQQPQRDFQKILGDLAPAAGGAR